MAPYLTLKTLPTKIHFLFRKPSWTEVKHIIPELKSSERQAAHKKKGQFHCNSLTCSKRHGKEKG